MKKKLKNKTKKCISLLLAVVMLLAMQGLPVLAETVSNDTIESAGRDMPKNPVHHCTKSNDGTDTTDWSYVYFGSYPQTEVTGDALTETITGASYDSSGDAWVGSSKYRRISKSDTNYNGYFGSSDYRYFKWERIKWRVLENNGSTLFVVADKGLDCKDYNEKYTSITWENCTLRSWLNSEFYGTAFSSSEQGAIARQNVVNEDNPYYGTEGGNDTSDNVFLLSIGEVLNPEYGFCEDYGIYSASRRMQASDYAHARGASVHTSGTYAGNCWWWLRSPGYGTSYAAIVSNSGNVDRTGDSVNDYYDACVPALHINLSSDLWSTADDGSSGEGGNGGTKDDRISSFRIDSTASGTIDAPVTLSGSLELSDQAETSSSILQQEIDGITWTSSDSAIAKVTNVTASKSSDNRSAALTVTVTPYQAGTVTITGTTSTGRTAFCEITVDDERKAVTIENYTFYVTDTSGDPIYNARIVVGTDSATTDTMGKAVFNRLKAWEDKNGVTTFDINIAAGGYSDYVEYNYAISDSHVTYITMLTIEEADDENGASLLKNDCFESVLFKDALFGNIDLMVNQKTISLSEPESKFQLTVKVKEDIKPSVMKYSIFSGSKCVAENKDGAFSDLEYSLFEADKKVYIRLDLDQGSGELKRAATERQQINLVVKNPEESVKNAIGSLSFGKSLTFTAPENAPFIGGATFDLAQLNLPLDLKLSTDGSFMISINTDDAKLIDKNEVLFKKAKKDKDTIKKEVEEKAVIDDSLFGMYKSAVEKSAENLSNGGEEKSFNEKKLELSDSFKFTTTIGGYISGKLTDSVKKGTGYIYIQVKSSYKASAEFVVVAVPVIVEIEVGATGKASAKAEIDFTDPSKSIGDSVKAEVLFYFAPYVKVSAGPGCSEVNAKINGGFTLPINYYMMGEKKGLDSIVLQADAKVTGKLFCLEKEWELVSGTFNVYTRAEGVDSAGADSGNPSADGLISLSDQSHLQVADYSDLAKSSGWNISSVKDTGSLILDEAVSNYAETKTVSAGDTVLMVYRDADTSRNAYNADTLFYSMYDKAAGTWSVPKQVDANDTADYAFDLYADGSDIYLAYQEMDREILPSDSVEDMAGATRIAFAKFDTDTEAFTDAVILAEGSSYVMQPSVVKDGSAVRVFWIENNSLDYYALNNTNALFCRTYENGAWSDAALLLQDSCKICEIEGCVLDQTAYLAYITDTDNNLSTIEDRNVMLAGIDGQTIHVTENDVLDANLVYSETDGTLYWYQDASIVRLSSIQGEPEALAAGLELNPSENFTLISDGQSQAVFFTQKDMSSEEEIAEAYLMYQQPDGTYSYPVQVTEKNSCISGFSGILTEEGALLNFRQDVFSYGEDTVETASSLCASFIGDFSKIAMDHLTYDYDTMETGQPLTMTADITNNSSHPITALDITLFAPSGEKQCESQLPVSLGIGETQNLSFEIQVPEELEMGDYILQAAESGSESAEPAQAEFRLLYADVSIAAELITLGENPYISAVVENRGDLPTTAAVTLVNNDAADDVIASYPVEQIDSHMYQTVLIPITGEMLTPGSIYSDFTVIAAPEKEDAYQYNNSAVVQLESYVRAMSFEQETVKLQKGGSKTLAFQIDALGTPEFTYEWKSSDERIASVDKAGTVTAAAKGTAVITVMTKQGDFAECTVTVEEGSAGTGSGQKPGTGTGENKPGSGEEKPGTDQPGSGQKPGTGTGTGQKPNTGTGSGTGTGTVPAVSKISIQSPSKKIAAGKKVSLSIAVSPKGAAKPKVTWTSSNKKYAAVNSKGIVTTKKAGKGKTVAITAAASDGRKAIIKLKIMKHAVTKVQIKNTSRQLKAGKTLTLKATVKANGRNANKTLKWTTSNKAWATVTAKGKVTAKKAGTGKTVTITAASTDGTNKKARVKIKIK